MTNSSKLYRFSDGTVGTVLEWCRKNAVRYDMVTNRSHYNMINRRKFHGMDNDEQKVYEDRLKAQAVKPEYRAYSSDDVYVVITKRDYMAAITEKAR